VRAGRIAVGPWYVLPDELLVSGESLVRNLEIGHRLASGFGGVPPLGYCPDQFGHTAQLPQILRGFGIDAVVVWRGVGADVARAEFEWEAPDGSSVLAVWLPHGYFNGFRLLDEPAALRARLDGIAAAQAPFQQTRTLLVMNGMDHAYAERGLPAALAAAANGLRVEIAPLAAYVARVRAEARDLPRHRGELRSALRAPLLPGVTSVRVRQKQRDFAATGRLERYAEPLATWADLLAGRRDLGAFVERAWRIAVENHPHDSICGCSIDQVHRDMEHRFDRVDLIGAEVVGRALEAVAATVDTTGPGGGRALVVYNPGVAGTAPVELPADEAPAAVATAGGAPLVVQATADGRRVVAAPLAGHGLTVLHPAASLPVVSAGTTAVPGGLENRWYRVAVAEDGSLAVVDKALDLVLHAHRLSDEGDRGDEYDFDPVDEPPITTPATPAEVSVVDVGPVAATLEVALTLRLPARLATDRARRTVETVEVPIRTTVTLWDAVRRIDFVTVLDNRATDHRLRVRVESPIVTDRVLVEQAFCTVERPFALEPPGEIERPIGTGPQRTFAALTDGRVGVALFNRGIPEVEGRATPGGSELALTLVRAVGWLSRSDLRSRLGPAGYDLETPEAQSPGLHRFAYALTTFAGDTDAASLVAEAHRFAYPPLAVAAERHPGALPSDAALVRVADPCVVVSAVLPGRRPRAYRVRCYNASAIGREATIVFSRAVGVRAVDLLGRRMPGRLARRGGTVRLPLRPWEIVTLEVTVARPSTPPLDAAM
jgi:alpha-mannosidase